MQVTVEEGEEGNVEEEIYDVQDEGPAGSVAVVESSTGARGARVEALAAAGAGLASWVHEGDHDVARAAGDGQTLVVVCEAAGVHEQPAQSGVAHRAVVAQEMAAPARVVYVCTTRVTLL
ncbi:hypothetical protein RR48_15453 [Papilio machaon]|uniref:Uncharacterized protein n=1 Tax=Papilio machaon TaxID=76193 RepID=A0A194QV17_PAPMA|nr:hypothetical protein RR48_15453 [Papilio machaon]